MVQPRRWGLCAAAATISVGFLAGCWGSDGGLVAVDPQPVPGSESSQVTAEVPDDWQLVTAGVGEWEQSWGSDTSGSDEPYTVLKRSEGDQTVTVSATGYEGYQGALAQAALSYPDNSTELTVDGRRALLSHGSETWDQPTDLFDLVVDLDGSSAVRAQGIDASRDELIELATLVIVDDDHRVAPRFEEVPSEFEVVGSVNSSGVLAMRARLSPGTDHVPGDDRTHTLGWTVSPEESPSSDPATVSVSTIPAATISLDAVELTLPSSDLISDRSVDRTEVAGRPGLEVTEIASERWRSLTLLTETDWGDQLVVTSRSDAESDAPTPTVEQLKNVAASVAQADDANWNRLVEEAAGGPGLNPNVGRTEIVRGEAGGIKWLLQTGDGLDGEMTPTNIDECLKLDNNTSACPTSSMGAPLGDSGLERILATGEFGPEKLPFAIMVVPNNDPATELRYTKDDTTITAPFHSVGDSNAKVSVLIANQDDRLDCPGPGDRPGILQRYDANDNLLGCID